MKVLLYPGWGRADLRRAVSAWLEDNAPTIGPPCLRYAGASPSALPQAIRPALAERVIRAAKGGASGAEIAARLGVSETIVGKYLAQYAPERKRGATRLSPEIEARLLPEFRAGKTDSRISAELGIHRDTVARYRRVMQTRGRRNGRRK